MFKIGAFSKICQVSIKTLRNWDVIGLLKPSYTDPTTNYRYYEIDQLQVINRILAYQGMGLSLRQVAQLLEEDLPVHEIRGMLRLKQAELQQQIEEDNLALQIVEARLQLIEDEDLSPNYDVVLKKIPPLRVLSIREIMPTIFIMIELLRETHTCTKNKGTLLAILHGDAYVHEMIDVELCLAVDAEYSSENKTLILPSGREMKLVTLPEIDTVASIVHNGRWVTLLEKYSKIGKWVQAHGYTLIGPEREIFHSIGWENDANSNVLEIQFPVTRSLRPQPLDADV
jgi:DNA-binding transcriptional MerR regulator/effector-binding domain-containing protein